jgi:hypothetical protein
MSDWYTDLHQCVTKVSQDYNLFADEMKQINGGDNSEEIYEKLDEMIVTTGNHISLINEVKTKYQNDTPSLSESDVTSLFDALENIIKIVKMSRGLLSITPSPEIPDEEVIVPDIVSATNSTSGYDFLPNDGKVYNVTSI